MMQKTDTQNLADNINQWNILIVDDTRDNVMVAKSILEFKGAKVIIAENGVNALEILQQEDPNIIITDLTMPEMDGWELHEHLRSQPKYRNFPIIALTAHAFNKDIEQVMAVGFSGYIAKPYTATTFLDTIRIILLSDSKS